MRNLALFGLGIIACVRAQTTPVVQAATQVAAVPSATTPAAECYALTYSDPRGDAQQTHFPTWIGLLPDGRADAGNLPDFLRRDGAAYKQWQHHIGTDSISVKFTSTMEGIDIELTRANANVVGRAIWLTDLVGLPESSLRVVGVRQSCPSQLLSSQQEMERATNSR